MYKPLMIIFTGVIALASLTGCTHTVGTTTSTPQPTTTVTVTAPAPTVTVTAPTPASTPTVTGTPTLSHLLPIDADIANLAYRSGMAGPTTQFTVPASGYKILYVCYALKPIPTDAGTAGYQDNNEGGSHNSGALTCDSKIHTLAADAAYVKKIGAVNKLTKLTLTGDRMFVLAIDMSVRPLNAR